MRFAKKYLTQILPIYKDAWRKKMTYIFKEVSRNFTEDKLDTPKFRDH
jgi:hypothetical protein